VRRGAGRHARGGNQKSRGHRPRLVSSSIGGFRPQLARAGHLDLEDDDAPMGERAFSCGYHTKPAPLAGRDEAKLTAPILEAATRPVNDAGCRLTDRQIPGLSRGNYNRPFRPVLCQDLSLGEYPRPKRSDSFVC
jgi:hypothetical protein